MMRTKKILSMLFVLLYTLLPLTRPAGNAFAEEAKPASFTFFTGNSFLRDSIVNASLSEKAIETLLNTLLSDPDSFISPTDAEGIRSRLEDYSNDGFIALDSFIRVTMEAEFGSYFGWSIENKHLYDMLLVEYGLLDNEINVLPRERDIQRENALAKAKQAISERFTVPIAQLDSCDVNEFFIQNTPEQGGGSRWSFAFIGQEDGDDVFLVEVGSDGELLSCTVESAKSNLDPIQEEFNALQLERGDFHLWSPSDKAAYSNQLGVILKSEGSLPPMLRAIAEQQFTNPTEQDLSEEQAIRLAVDAVRNKYGLAEGYETTFLIGRGLYLDGEARIWQIGFWPAPEQKKAEVFWGGRVRIDARSGEVISTDAHEGDTVATYIPYEEMF